MRHGRVVHGLLLLIAWLVCRSALAAPPVIIVDPGHDPRYPGARGSCGESEYHYNDRVADAYLKNTAARVLLTRAPGQAPVMIRPEASSSQSPVRAYSLTASLQARTDFARAHRGDLFISIHHDSVASRFIVRDDALCGGRGGHTVAPAFRERHAIGFNIFIDQDEKNPHYRDSLRFARLLGEELRRLGRKPSDYHYFPDDDCRSCRPVIRDLGIWHQQLYVLRHASIPAVLIEVGNIADAGDEAQINTDQFRLAFARALDSAVTRYFSPKN